jgi:ABC-type Mn2+/Zn2+ transport system ATPase subunit
MRSSVPSFAPQSDALEPLQASKCLLNASAPLVYGLGEEGWLVLLVGLVRDDRRWWRGFGSRTDPVTQTKAEELLTLVGLQDRRTTLSGELAHGEKQWLEIGMVVASGCELLLLDEPTAGMGASESRRTADIIRSLAGQKSVLVIDHDIDFVEQLGGHVVVLHQGTRFVVDCQNGGTGLHSSVSSQIQDQSL